MLGGSITAGTITVSKYGNLNKLLNKCSPLIRLTRKTTKEKNTFLLSPPDGKLFGCDCFLWAQPVDEIFGYEFHLLTLHVRKIVLCQPIIVIFGCDFFVLFHKSQRHKKQQHQKKQHQKQQLQKQHHQKQQRQK